MARSGQVMAAGVALIAVALAVAPANAAASCTIHKADFQRLDMGMGFDQVAAILRCAPLSDHAGGYAGAASRLYRWPVAGGFLMALFVEGKLINYSEAGLDAE